MYPSKSIFTGKNYFWLTEVEGKAGPLYFGGGRYAAATLNKSPGSLMNKELKVVSPEYEYTSMSLVPSQESGSLKE